jgi:23S rRNA (cytosine1962-C5)-methyltransferase
MKDRFVMFRNRLTKVYRHRSKQAKRSGVCCFRIYDHDLPEFPFCIELYEKKLYVAEWLRRHHMTESEHERWLEECLDVIAAVLSFQKENIFLKLRMRKPGRLGQYRKQGKSGNKFTVEENGLKFIVNLSDYLDTGLFLDHRITRQLVKEQSKDKAVLNLFAYTGSFSVYAAAGGASEVVTIDLSNTYLDWSKRNMELNGFTDSMKYKFVQADVKQWLDVMPLNNFDLIILDPPTFSNSKRMEDFLDLQKDHVGMINQCLKGLKPGGILYFSTNYKKFELDRVEILAEEIKDITKATTPFDFAGRLERKCFLIRK